MTIKWVKSDPLVMNGEPFVYGTRLTVRRLLELRASGYDAQRLIAEMPELRIVGIARADIYFGAGEDAGRVSGRMKNPGRFVMLFPNEIDPFKQLRDIPLPRPRPKLPGDPKPEELMAEKPAATPAATAWSACSMTMCARSASICGACASMGRWRRCPTSCTNCAARACGRTG